MKLHLSILGSQAESENDPSTQPPRGQDTAAARRFGVRAAGVLMRYRWFMPVTLAIVLFGAGFLLAIVGGFGASRSAPAPAADHEPATLPVTVWNDGFEIFVELPPLVRGQQVALPFHLTMLATGEPVASGTATFVADGPARQQVRAAAGPKAPGVFVLSATFPAAGRHQGSLQIATGTINASIALPPIEVYDTPQQARAAIARAAGEASGVKSIAFLKEQQWRLGTLIAPVTRRQLVERLVVPGSVRVPPGAGAIVTPPVAGTLQPPPGGAFPAVGEQVEQGQTLAVFEPSLAGGAGVQLQANQAQLESLDAELSVKQLQVETAAKVAEHELVFAQRLLKRLENLAPGGVVTQRQLDDAKLSVLLAEQRLAGAKEQLRPYNEARHRLSAMLGRSAPDSTAAGRIDLRVTLKSPLAGTVVEANATAGQYLNVGERVFRVVSLKMLWIEARVSEYDLGRVQQAPGASFRLSAYPDEIVPILGTGGGRLVDVGAVVDPANRTVAVRYEVPNPSGHLRVDMFAEVLVDTKTRENALAVPTEAIVDEGGEPIVYVQLGGESFERRPVKLGIADAGLVEVQSGLAEGERVVERGAYAIRLSSMSGAMPVHDHDH